jgi:hypothetical protein
MPCDPEIDGWRLEFKLRREAVTSLKQAPESDAEDLPNVGTLPTLFTHLDVNF